MDVETIRGLNKTIDKLRKEVKELYRFREMFIDLNVRHEFLEKQLYVKRNAVRIEQEKDGINYLMQIKELHDTPEGLYIKI